MMKNKTFLLVLFAAFSLSMSAQVTGTVLDASTAEPIIGANVIEKGTTNGTITDFDGNFVLMAQEGALLEISYMGHKTVEVKATNGMQIQLGEDTELLDEVVVVGYGVVKKNDATGSVTAIKPDAMNKGLTTNAQDMLAGKVAGVVVTSNDGTPGGGATIRVRGGSSLSASNDPLIVIDGLAMDNEGIPGAANPLSMVNPNDIETFTVLKDASATAIYGSRASNGVIIITTKKGAAGQKLKVSYDGNVSAGVLTNMVDVMTGDEYREFLGASDLGAANTDWQKEIYRTAISTDHTISIMGGTKNMPYRAAIGYTNQNGVIKTSNMQRVTASLNLSPTFLDKHLSFNFNVKGMYIYNRYADGGAVGSAIAFDPTREVMPADGGLKEFGGYYQTPKSGDDLNDPSWTVLSNTNTPQNPVALLDNKDDRANSGAFVGNLEVDYKVHGFEDLRLHANFGADYSFGKQHTVILPISYSNNYYGWDGLTKKSKYNLQFNAYAQYYKDFSDNQHFDIMAGYEWQHFYRDESYEGSGFMGPDAFAIRDMNKRHNLSTNEFATESYLVSFFGRANWVGWNQVMLTATVRADGSSRFAKGKRWGIFPSVALGWKIKETFLQDVHWINDLKLRAGYGITGQQNLDSDYIGLQLYAPSKEYADYTFGEIDPETGQYIYHQSARPQAYNFDLTWEKTTTYNAGIDFGFLNNRVSGNIDYYYRYTTDLISKVDVPMGTNYKNQVNSNIGSLSNQGVEFMINGVAIDNKNLKWDMGINFTYNINKIEHLTSGQGTDYYVATGGVSSGTGNTIQRHQEGYAANTFFVYESYISKYKTLEIVDQNEDGTINEKDLIPFHKPAPDFQIGFQSKWQFYNFDLSFSLRSNIGNYVYNDVLAGKMASMKTLAREGGYTNVMLAAQEPYKMIENSLTVTTDNAWQLSEFVENASFLRCDNITLGYTFNEPKIKARIFATVSNPFVISGYRGLDPEVFSGIDNNMYPRSMTTVLGVSLQF